MKWRWDLAALAALAAAALGACGGIGVSEAQTCLTDRDCISPRLCYENICVNPASLEARVLAAAPHAGVAASRPRRATRRSPPRPPRRPDPRPGPNVG